MDALINHCIKELAFDGDLGCSPQRLKIFARDYWSSRAALHQNLDDLYFSHLWRIIVQQPAVRVGLVTDAAVDVAIAPQNSKARQKKTLGESSALIQPPLHANGNNLGGLSIISDACTRSLEELQLEHHDKLRIAVSRDISFFMITGSHARPSKLTPMVYTCLQLVTRGRRDGITVMDLGTRSGYDQKTCFYLVKQLLELDLVVKLRRPGIGTHFVLHKYFYERDEIWQKIREEEKTDEMETMASSIVQGNVDDQITQNASALIKFDPIDARHLSSLPLVRSRVTRLLQQTDGGAYPLKNLLPAIGFNSPTKTDRRFFATRLNELHHEGLIEKVKGEDPYYMDISAVIRLVSPRSQHATSSTEETSNLATPRAVQGHSNYHSPQEALQFNSTIHSSVLETIIQAEGKGITVNELFHELGQFDKRLLESLLLRMEQSSPPIHMTDLVLCDIMETFGREHRHRFFSLAAYRSLIGREAAHEPDQRYLKIDTEQAGRFFADSLTADDFYASNDYIEHGDLSSHRKLKPSSHSTLKRMREEDAEGHDDIAGPLLHKRLKTNTLSSLTAHGNRKRSPSPASQPKKRGRPRKNPLPATPVANSGKTPESQTLEQQQPTQVKRGRGRPRKVTIPDITTGMTAGTEIRIVQHHSGKIKPRHRRAKKKARVEGGGQDESQGVNAVVIQNIPPDDHTSEHVNETLHITTVSSGGPEDVVQDAESSALDALAVAQENSSDGQGSNIPIDKTTALSSRDHLSVPNAPSKARDHNISRLRRQKELLRLLDAADGVMNIATKELGTKHLQLLQEMHNAGEQTSAPPGSRLDHRTIVSTVDQLVKTGAVKVITSIIPDAFGAQKTLRMIYRVELEPKITEILSAMGGEQSVLNHASLPEVLRGQSHAYLDETVTPQCLNSATNELVEPASELRQLFLKDKQTVMQLFGAAIGRISRAKRLHIIITDYFSRTMSSRWFVSTSALLLHISFFWTDISVSEYCELVTVLQYDAALERLLQDDVGRSTSVKDLPLTIRSVLQPGLARCRAKIRELLTILAELGLVVPMKSVEGDRYTLEVKSSEPHPSRFQEIVIDSPSLPLYWKFAEKARQWEFNENGCQIHHAVPVYPLDHTSRFWSNLESTFRASESFPPSSNSDPSTAQELGLSQAMIQSLRRAASWAVDYVFSLNQVHYLRDVFSSSRIDRLDLDSSAIRVSEIARNVCAPQIAVRKYLTSLATRRRKARVKIADEPKGDSEISSKPASRQSVNSSAEVKARRQLQWEELLKSIYPGQFDDDILSRLQLLKLKFTNQKSSIPIEQWAEDIRRTVSARLLDTRAVIRTDQQLPSQSTSKPQQKKSVEDLVFSLSQKPTSNAGANITVEGDSETKTRRTRFHWNKELDELALDLSVIVRTRCRTLNRMDWGAVEQIFSNMSRNSVRARVHTLRQDPATDSYVRRMEDKWAELWLENRGTDTLPDDDLTSATNFDVIAHLEFLRQHIDKNALLLGVGEDHAQDVKLPKSVGQALQTYSFETNGSGSVKWDALWLSAADDTREKILERDSFIVDGLSSFQKIPYDDDIALAHAALKMVLDTADEDYDEMAASAVLKSLPEITVSKGIESLLGLGVLTRVVSDSDKVRPGKMFRISDINYYTSAGPLGLDFLQDVMTAQEGTYAEGEHEWGVAADDGDVANLLHLVSDGKVEFKIDATEAVMAGRTVDWNSKKVGKWYFESSQCNNTFLVYSVDDDQLETKIIVSQATGSQPAAGVEDMAVVINDNTSGHSIQSAEEGHVSDGNQRFCGRMSDGLIDCHECLNEAMEYVVNTLDAVDASLVSDLRREIESSGPGGVAKHLIVSWFRMHNVTRTVAERVLALLTQSSPPFVFWGGYAQTVLISTAFARNWSVVVADSKSKGSRKLVLPRRWLDLSGNTKYNIWNAAHTLIVTTVLMRPGITMADLFNRHRLLFDRQEIEEIVFYLTERQVLRKEYSQVLPETPLCLVDDQSTHILIGAEGPWATV